MNDSAEPLVNAADTETFGDRFFYGTDTIGPHGTAWAGFHCAKTSACPGRRIGVVGRLTKLRWLKPKVAGSKPALSSIR